MIRLVSSATRARPDLLEDLTAEVSRRLIEKDLERSRPAQLDCPAAWFARVIINEAHDALRQTLAQKRGGGAAHDNLEESGAMELRAATAPVDPAEHIDTKRQWSQIAHIAMNGDIPGRPRLGFLAFFLARHIARRHVEEAKAQVDRSREGVDGGLLRSVDETWGMLCDGLMRRHPEGVDGDDEGHLELAFVLRSTHPGPAAEWGRSDRQVVAKARDLVRKWAARGRDQVKALALADGGGR